MATMPELIAVLEAAKIDTGPTLALFARRLREAGRLTKAGRGRGAAHVTYLDAARLLLACAATEYPEKAVLGEDNASNAVFFNSEIERNDNSELAINADVAPTADIGLAILLETLAKDKTGKNVRWPILHLDRSFFTIRLCANDSVWRFRHAATLRSKTSAVSAEGRWQRFDHATAPLQSGKNIRVEIDADTLRPVAQLLSVALATDASGAA